MRQKAAVLLLGLLIGSSAVPSVAAGDDTSKRPVVTLRGKTTFSTSRAGFVRFHLPKKVEIRRDFDFDVKGDGRVYGFTFWKSGGRAFFSPGVEYMQAGLCTTKGCNSKSDGNFAFVSGRHLPAGNYDLYVVADGAPVQITFTTPTLQGRASYEPAAVDAHVTTLAPTMDVAQGAQMYSAGGFTRLREADYSFFGMWALNRNDVATAYGSCAYYEGGDVPNPPEAAAFLPGCPTGDSFEFVNPGPNGGTVLTVSDHGGSEGTGGWFSAGSSHDRYGAVAFWLDI